MENYSGLLFVCLACGGVLFAVLSSLRLRKRQVAMEAQFVHLQQELEESEGRYRSLLQASPDGIILSDLTGRISEVNHAVLRMFGYPDQEALKGKTIVDFIHPDDRERMFVHLDLLRQGRLPGPADYRAVRVNGDVFHISANGEFLLDALGHPKGLLFIDRDISKRKMAELALAESNRHLATLSNTDALTGLSNRRCFNDVLNKEYSRHVRNHKPLSLILLDVDYFKQYNDIYGHLAGDECLRQISRVMSGVLNRPADLVARYGGEEFVCILPETDLEGVSLIAEKIRTGILNLNLEHVMSSAGKVVSVSLGVVCAYCLPDNAVDSFLSMADEMLYKAKASGRNRIYARTVRGTPPREHEPLVPLAWKDAYLCGHPVIDQEHKRLFSLVNRLLEIMVLGWSPEKVNPRLEELFSELQNHFEHEDSVWRDQAVPGWQEHQREHERLLSLARSHQVDFMEKRLGNQDLYDFVANQIVKLHMLGADALLYPYLQKDVCDAAFSVMSVADEFNSESFIRE